MRRAEISGKQVRCPNVSVFAYSRPKAQVGDWLVFKEFYGNGEDDYRLRVGRMFGRIESAEYVQGETRSVVGFIACLALSDDLGSAWVRWVDPKDVVESQPHAQGRQAFLNWFAGNWPQEYKPSILVQLQEYGTLGWNYIGGVASAALAFTHGVGVSALRTFGLEEAKRLAGKVMPSRPQERVSWGS